MPVKNPTSTHGQIRQAKDYLRRARCCCARWTAAGPPNPARSPVGGRAGHSVGQALEEREHSGGEQPGIRGEINRKGETVWEWTTADSPDYKLASLQTATRLPNGNTLVTNWFNQWSSKLPPSGPTRLSRPSK